MTTNRGKRLWVSKNLAEKLEDGYKQTNSLLEGKLKKKLSFIDYTEIVAKSINSDGTMIRGLLKKKKMGRGESRDRVEFEIFGI